MAVWHGRLQISAASWGCDMSHLTQRRKKEGYVCSAAPFKNAPQSKPHFQRHRRASQLLADSRSLVIEKRRADEKKAAAIFRLTPRRRAQLRRIALTVRGHDARILRALQTGELTAAHAVEELDTHQPHARFGGLRVAGHLLISRWVRLATATGGTRLVKAYSLVDDGSAE